MKNKLTCLFLTLVIISTGINGSDCDSPEERAIVPHLNVSAIESNMLFNLASAQACIRCSDLHVFVRDNNLQAVKDLITSGADVNAKGLFSMTPLTVGAYKGCQLEIIDELIKARADVNQGSYLGGSPLTNAIEKGRVEHVRVLLAAGANPNCRSVEGIALEIAVRFNHIEIVRMLIGAGATVNSDILSIAVIKDNLNIVKALVDAGANVNDSNLKYSVLSMVNKKNTEMKDYLESKGAVTFWSESCSIQ